MAAGAERLMNASVDIRRVPEGSGLDLMAPLIEKSKGATAVGRDGAVGGRAPRGTINTRVVLINLISSVIRITSNNDLCVPLSRTGSRTDNTPHLYLLHKQSRCVLSSNSSIFR